MFKKILIALILCGLAVGTLQLKQKIKNQPVIPQQVNLSDRIEQVFDSVVHITNETQGWQGSGVIISPNIIMTARHVIEGGDSFIITTCARHKLIATKAISSKKYDLGFIKIDDLICSEQQGHDFTKMPSGAILGLDHLVTLKPARLGSVKQCRLGQQVFVIGSPYGKLNFNNVTLGIVSGLNRNWDEINPRTGKLYGWSIAFTTDSAGHPGNSGCPVFTTDGKVRGILVGRFSPVLICCMPIDLVITDLPLISAMFAIDNYYLEEVKK